MTQDRMTTLFFEIFNGLPRQGPGDAASTRRALAMVPGVGTDTRVLDLGCGTGAQTLVLAQSTAAGIIANDNHQPFVEQLKDQARALGIGDRIDARVGDMCRLDFATESFDLIWCEGAIYVIGFDAGLREWRRLLAPGGHLVVSEVCWATPDRPAECAEFWAREYPAIRETSALVAVIDECGYELIGNFAIPPSAWWDDYYRPLQEHVTAFRRRHQGEPDADDLANHVQREIDIWHSYAAYYRYEFFVMHKTGVTK